MPTVWRAILIATFLLMPALTGAEQDERSGARKPTVGSVSRQLMLKYRLRKIAEGTLTASLSHNNRQWMRLSPDQRDKYRRDVLAFRTKSDDQQAKLLLTYYESLARLSAEKQRAHQRRARWLKIVVDSFTPHERKTLKELPPEQRARRLIGRRDELIRLGKLTLRSAEPTSIPVSTTQPAFASPAEE